jgi:uncharacterized protein (DUF2062 family)
VIEQRPAAQESSNPSFRERAASLRRQGWSRLRGGALTPKRAGWSVAFGVFIGCLPAFGLHLPLCLAVCVPLRLDAPVAYLAANISNPLVAPWLIVAEVQSGAWIVTGSFVAFSVDAARGAGVGGFAAYAAVGALVVGLTLAAFAGLATAAIVAARRNSH